MDLTPEDISVWHNPRFMPGLEKDYRLVTCLAVFKSALAHHCRLEQPHTTHRCACGIKWRDDV